MIRLVLLVLALLFGAQHAAAEPAAERLQVLRRGVNVTNWFRYPPSQDLAGLRAYLSDPALRQLRAAGFTFIRLPVQPELLALPGVLPVLVEAVHRVERAGLGVVVSLHPTSWHLETVAADREELLAVWRELAAALRALDPRLTFPELLNEPVFPGNPAGWGALQQQTLVAVRAILPTSTLVLTGNDWGSVAGLLALTPDTDRNVIYSFHLYDPPELTALAAYRPGLDTAALARLPFPADNEPACQAIAAATVDPPTSGLMRFYCAQRWDTDKLEARVAEAAAWASRHGVAVLAGEFGASRKLNPTARMAWVATVRTACEREGIGWALWGYEDVMGFAMHPLAGPGSLDPAMLQALGLAGAIPTK